MARPASTTLDHFRASDRPTPPRDRTPGDDVREVDARSALTDCGLPGTPYSLNPYLGCTHGCRYCYVPSITHRDQARWGTWLEVKRNLPRLLSREVRRRDPGLVFMSSATDPYQPAEGRYEITRRSLEVLQRVDWPLRVLTRSPLILRDLDLLPSFSDIRVGVSIPTLDDGFRQAVEPKAPPVAGRLRALERIHDAGIPTFASLAPTYPLTDGWTPGAVAERVASTGVDRVFFGRWNYRAKAQPATLRQLVGTPYERYGHEVFDEEATTRRIRELAEAFKHRGLDVGVPD